MHAACQTGLARQPEEAVRRRRSRRAERSVADRAAGLAVLPAQGNVLEVAAHVLPDRHLQAGAEQHRRHQAVAQHGVRVDLLRISCVRMAGALRVSDQDDAATAVVVGDVMLPGIEDVGIREATVDRDGIAAQATDERGERDLTVDRREHAAHLAETRRLLAHDVELLVGARARGRCCPSSRGRWWDRRRSSRCAACAPRARSERGSCRSPSRRWCRGPRRRRRRYPVGRASWRDCRRWRSRSPDTDRRRALASGRRRASWRAGRGETSHAWVAWAHNGTPRAAPGSTEIRQASSPPGTWRLLSVIRRSSVA